jgi:CBS domain-containing protein
MKAREVMTSDVVSVSADTPARQIARLLLDRAISAVPVVDDSGAPLGMVSEGDLVGRGETDREARRDWWLTLLAEGTEVSPEFLVSLHAPERTARDLMSGPVVTVGEETDVKEIARLLASHRIKRVPVIRDGHIVGIVSRADLLRAVAEEQAPPAAAAKGGVLASAFTSLDERFVHRHHAATSATAAAPSEPSIPGPKAADFRDLVAGFERKELQHRQAERRTAAEQRQRQVTELIDQHISDSGWRSLLHQARQAAEQGQSEFMLLRFPRPALQRWRPRHQCGRAGMAGQPAR